MKEQVGLNKFSTLFVLFLFSFGVTLFSQERKQDSDSLVRLIEAKTAQLVQENDISYRKIVGPARFLHNDTFLLCDTAIWNVNSNVINAIGNVQVIQENTFLTGDRIEYIIDENLAKVRGNLVELFDKEGNILRTNFLDYNTKDSIGTFFYGGAMRNSDGNLIESDNGIYSSADKLFKFINDVNMFTDSVFVKSDEVDYRTDLNIAYFGNNTTAWQEGNILRANSGEFIRGENIFNFNKDAYILTQDQELWADILKFNRNTNKADLYNNIQLTDTVQNIIALGDRAEYISNPMYTKLTEDPAILMCSDEDGIKDTLYIKGDQFIYYSKSPSSFFAHSPFQRAHDPAG